MEQNNGHYYFFQIYLPNYNLSMDTYNRKTPIMMEKYHLNLVMKSFRQLSWVNVVFNLETIQEDPFWKWYYPIFSSSIKDILTGFTINDLWHWKNKRGLLFKNISSIVHKIQSMSFVNRESTYEQLLMFQYTINL